MAGLLVSVRSAEEALAAVRGGATVIDVKEPSRGPLGRADPAIWAEVRSVVPPTIPVSLAMGELVDWQDWADSVRDFDFQGIRFVKLGLAGVGADWAGRWLEILRAFPQGPGWVGVVYADWRAANSPSPDALLDVALESPDCVGILVDTWDKSRPSSLGLSEEWVRWVSRVHESKRFLALAGGLDRAAIGRLGPLRPDLFAVRSAACAGNRRLAEVNTALVADLVVMAQSIESKGRSNVDLFR